MKQKETASRAVREKQRSGSRRFSGNRPSTRACLPQTEPKSSTLGLSGEDSSDQRGGSGEFRRV
ncbi:hypothetical protein Hdeb2414_s0021g00576891 [Helianthus debilis subsp. tardiflorus]